MFMIGLLVLARRAAWRRNGSDRRAARDGAKSFSRRADDAVKCN